MKVTPYTEEYIKSLHSDPVWQAIWAAIREWDIEREPDAGRAGASGTDATHIYESIRHRGCL